MPRRDINLHDNEILVRNPLLTLLIVISPDSSIFKGAPASDPQILRRRELAYVAKVAANDT